MIDKLFTIWGYKLTGKVRYQGEYFTDAGLIYIENDSVKKEVFNPKFL